VRTGDNGAVGLRGSGNINYNERFSFDRGNIILIIIFKYSQISAHCAIAEALTILICSR